MYSPTAIDAAPATIPAMAAVTRKLLLTLAAETPIINEAMETKPSLAPRIAALSQPALWVR